MKKKNVLLRAVLILLCFVWISCEKLAKPVVEDPIVETPPTPIEHGSLRKIAVTNAGTKEDYNSGNYLFNGHKHINLRFTDFDQATSPLPANNTKAGWQSYLDGIYPIMTSDDFNSASVASGATVELTGGPSPSGKWLKKQSSEAIKALFPSNHRLRNWNLFDNVGFKPAVYVSFYLQTFSGDDAGKPFRMYWHRDLPSADSKYSTSFWMGKPIGSSYTWRVEWAGNGELGGYGDQQFTIDGQWNRVELLFDFVADTHAILVNGKLLTDVSRSYNGVINGQLGVNSAVRYALLGNTIDPMLEDGHHMGWAQPYADFSLKRIEIADSSDWSTKTKSVVQPVKSWAPNEIEFIINRGDFADLNNKHIFLLDGLNATYLGAL
jgi:hypothetical protein